MSDPVPLKESSADLSRQEQSYLDAAIALARTSTCTQKHGAIITKGGSILSVGVNRRRNDPAVTVKGATFHAEEMAIRNLRGADANKAKIYVARVSKLDIPALSRPCNRCYVLIKRMGIKEIYYTDWTTHEEDLNCNSSCS
jgi:tRNA(Arg) A34 adenosine deaminase TadA